MDRLPAGRKGATYAVDRGRRQRNGAGTHRTRRFGRRRYFEATSPRRNERLGTRHRVGSRCSNRRRNGARLLGHRRHGRDLDARARRTSRHPGLRHLRGHARHGTLGRRIRHGAPHRHGWSSERRCVCPWGLICCCTRGCNSLRRRCRCRMTRRGDIHCAFGCLGVRVLQRCVEVGVWRCRHRTLGQLRQTRHGRRGLVSHVAYAYYACPLSGSHVRRECQRRRHDLARSLSDPRIGCAVRRIHTPFGTRGLRREVVLIRRRVPGQ